jgi:hypothetical protein
MNVDHVSKPAKLLLDLNIFQRIRDAYKMRVLYRRSKLLLMKKGWDGWKELDSKNEIFTCCFCCMNADIFRLIKVPLRAKSCARLQKKDYYVLLLSNELLWSKMNRKCIPVLSNKEAAAVVRKRNKLIFMPWQFFFFTSLKSCCLRRIVVALLSPRSNVCNFLVVSR